MGRVEILMGVERRRNWTDEQKLRILEEVASSDQGIARRHDVLPQQIYCLVSECDGLCLSSSERDALWVRFYTGAPRLRTPFEQNYSDRKLRPRNWRGATGLTRRP